MAASYARAKELLVENREVMDELAKFLIEKETITGKEFMKIFRKLKGIPEPEEEKTEETKDSAEAKETSEVNDEVKDNAETKDTSAVNAEENIVIVADNPEDIMSVVKGMDSSYAIEPEDKKETEEVTPENNN